MLQPPDLAEEAQSVLRWLARYVGLLGSIERGVGGDECPHRCVKGEVQDREQSQLGALGDLGWGGKLLGHDQDLLMKDQGTGNRQPQKWQRGGDGWVAPGVLDASVGLAAESFATARPAGNPDALSELVVAGAQISIPKCLLHAVSVPAGGPTWDD